MRLSQEQTCFLSFISGGEEALSSFGVQFFDSIDKLYSECANERNRLASELEEVKNEAEEFQVELKQLFPSSGSRDAGLARSDHQKVRALFCLRGAVSGCDTFAHL